MTALVRAEKFYVRIDRDDGSRTYKGPWSMAHCDYEAQAWRNSFPTYAVKLVPVAEARGDVRAWSKTVGPAAPGRYFPKET